MRILHISTNDYGGAGSAAVRIHLAHKKLGLESRLIVKNKTIDAESIFEYKRNSVMNIFLKLMNVMRRVIIFFMFNKKYLMYSILDLKKYNLLDFIKKDTFKPQLIIFHWVSGFANVDDIREIAEYYNCPVYWYLMDMAPLTGGCHFSHGCKNYNNSCMDCPADKLSIKKGIPFYLMQRKKKIHRDGLVKFLFPNEWVYNQFSKDNIIKIGKDIMYIPIDEEVFHPKLRESFIEFFILFGSNKLDDPRKGGKYFLEMLNKLEMLVKNSYDNKDLKKIKIIIPGIDSQSNLSCLPFDLIKLPYAKGEQELASLYQQCDLFVCCSIEDSGPMMVSESLMSGVPVIGFEMGVCPELIINDFNGAVVPLRDIDSMAKYIFKWIQSENYSEMKKNARNTAVKTFSVSAHFNQLKLNF